MEESVGSSLVESSCGMAAGDGQAGVTGHPTSRRGGAGQRPSSMAPGCNAAQFLRSYVVRDPTLPEEVAAIKDWLDAHQDEDPLRLRRQRDQFRRQAKGNTDEVFDVLSWMYAHCLLRAYQALLDVGFTPDEADEALVAAQSHGMDLRPLPPLDSLDV